MAHQSLGRHAARLQFKGLDGHLAHDLETVDDHPRGRHGVAEGLHLRHERRDEGFVGELHAAAHSVSTPDSARMGKRERKGDQLASSTTPPVGLRSHGSGSSKSAGGLPCTAVAGTHEMTMVGG